MPKSKLKLNLIQFSALLKHYFSLRSLSLLHTTWFLFVVVMVLFFTLIVPPLQKPDEYIHFQKAISLAYGQFFCEPTTQFTPHSKYAEVFTTVDKYGITQNYGGKFDYKELLKPPFAQNSLNEISVVGHACQLPSTAYLVQAGGLTIANLLNLNPLLSFYLGRLTVAILFVLTLLWSLNYSQSWVRSILLVFASIPMVAQQAGAYSYDAIQIVIGLVIFSLLLKLMEAKKVSWQSVVTYCSFLFLLQITKNDSYWPLFLTPLLFVDIFIKSVKKRTAILVISSFAGLTLLTFGLNQLDKIAEMSHSELSQASIQAQLFHEDKANYFWVIFNTLKFDFEFYFKSLLGNLGWLDYQLGLSVYLLVFALIVYVGARFSFRRKIEYPLLKSLLILLIIFSLFSLVIVGMYLGHTANVHELGGLVSYGGQGRYFLLLIPLFFVLMGLINQSTKVKYVFFVFSAIFLMLKIGEAVYLRYFDYQSLYDVPEIHSVLRDEKKAEFEKLELKSAKTFELELEPNRRLKGFTLGYLLEEKKMIMPYRYFVLEGNCEDGATLLAKGSTQPKYFSNHQLTILLPRHLEPIAGNKVCLKLDPVSTEFEKLPTVKPIVFVNEVQIMPVYMR